MTDVYTIENGQEITIKQATYSLVSPNIDRMSRHITRRYAIQYATTCVQYVRPDIVDTWMGDSPQRLVGKVYTHSPDEFMYEQMDLVQFEF